MIKNPEYDTWLSVGGYLKTSGTTGKPKDILQSPDKIKASNTSAILAQELDRKSQVLTVGKLKHAGGIFAQTLPAYSIGASIDLIEFSADSFVANVHKYTHTHLIPSQVQELIDTKPKAKYSNLWVTCGSTPVHWDMIEYFVNRGATLMANWGMTEVGPIAINATFKNKKQVAKYKSMCPEGHTILGDTMYCDYKIVDGELFVKGNISVYGNYWFNTGDLVTEIDNVLFFKGRK